MLINTDDIPNIGLKVSFDNVPAELYTLIDLISVLIIITIIFLSLHTINFTIKKCMKIYSNFGDYNKFITYE